MRAQRRLAVAILGLVALALLLGGRERATAGPMPPLVLDLTPEASTGTFGGNFDVPGTSGWKFTVTTPITVDGLGVWGVSAAEHDVGLWTGTGTLLASTTVNDLATPVPSAFFRGFQWYFEPITPLTLTPGDYVVGATFVSGDLDFPRDMVSVTTIPGVTFDSNRFVFNNGATLNFPTGSEPSNFNAGFFGPNLEVDVSTPEPSSLALLALGASALALLRHRRNA